MPTPAAKPHNGRHTALVLLVDMALPVGVYYGLRAAGVGSYPALIASALVPLASALVQFLRERRLDGMAAFVAGVILLGLVASLVSGSTRFMLAKDGWVTGAGGLWFLGTIWARRPLAFLGARPFLEGRFRSDGTSWDVLWEESAKFRRIWRVSTVIWGSAMIIDGLLRVLMAYALPVDAVPGLGGLLWPVTLVLLQVVNGAYYQWAGLWQITRPSQGRELVAPTAGPSVAG
ncbi:VC0807 family protein [Streptacidiphilus sp. PAMC 29251]